MYHPFSWSLLPAPLAALAAQGCTEQEQLFALADAALQQPPSSPAQAQICTSMAQEAMRMAWEGRLLDPTAAHLTLSLHQARPFLPAPMIPWARTVAAAHAAEKTAVARRRLTRLPPQARMPFLHDWRQREPENLFVIAQGVRCAVLDGDAAQAVQWLRDCRLPRPVRAGLEGDVLLLFGRWEEALDSYTAALQDFPCLLWEERRGEAALRGGDVYTCRQAWHDVVRQRPWHSALCLRLDDVLHQRHEPPTHAARPHGTGVVLLPTHNNATALNDTLQALFASPLHDIPVVVLDNASSDDTAHCLRAWKEKAPRCRTLCMDACIGAPAARNWLLNEPEARAADWLVWLEDDVCVPPHWLGSFAAAMQAMPHSGLYGCRIDAGTPPHLYGCDTHIALPADAPDNHTDVADDDTPVITAFGRPPLAPSAPAWDMGQRTFLRTCASVPSGCQLVRRSAVDAVGMYDLRFSPQGCEDADYHLRLCRQGLWPVYQGQLCVRRATPSLPAASAPDATDTGEMLTPATGNSFKLRGKYTPTACAAMQREEHALLLDDLTRRQTPPDTE